MWPTVVLAAHSAHLQHTSTLHHIVLDIDINTDIDIDIDILILDWRLYLRRFLKQWPSMFSQGSQSRPPLAKDGLSTTYTVCSILHHNTFQYIIFYHNIFCDIILHCISVYTTLYYIILHHILIHDTTLMLHSIRLYCMTPAI